MRRIINWKTVSTLAVMASLSGCGENFVSAPQGAAVAPASMMLAPDAAPRLGLGGGKADNTTATFTVGPWGGIFFAGNHAVIIPARGICDPATSSYGPGTWDQPCKPLNANLKVVAEVRVENGRTWVDFTPSLRFVPSNNPSEWAYIYMYTPKARGASDLAKFSILYAPRIGAASIDESVDDATLRTYVDKKSGVSMRRIKHFSGYNSSGFSSTCTPGVDPECYENDPNGKP